jgi:hypothetical protein
MVAPADGNGSKLVILSISGDNLRNPVDNLLISTVNLRITPIILLILRIISSLTKTIQNTSSKRTSAEDQKDRRNHLTPGTRHNDIK